MPRAYTKVGCHPPIHHPPQVSIHFTNGLAVVRGARWRLGEVYRVTRGHPRVTIGHLRVTVGHLRFTIGHLRVTIGHPGVTIGHPRLTLDYL